MLNDLKDLVRADRGPILSAVFVGALLGMLLGLQLDRVGGASPTGAAVIAATPTVSLPDLPENAGPKKATTPTAGGGDPPPEAEPTAEPSGDNSRRRAIAAALTRAVKATRGGTAEAAVFAEGWDAPVTAGDAKRKMRMWSMSKPVTAVAAVQATGTPSKELATAMASAIQRSENCPQRRVVIGLQEKTGGPGNARQAVQRVLRRAGVTDVSIPSGTVEPDGACRQYLSSQQLPNSLRKALQLGIVEWTVEDAVRFAAALGQGTYGSAGNYVMDLMRRPKQESTEIPSTDDYTANANWGAGRVFGRVAYKAGWGGSNQDPKQFMAGQYAIVQSGGRTVAIAAMFHPSTQPDRDDPGRTPAPQAIEAIFDAVKRELG